MVHKEMDRLFRSILEDFAASQGATEPFETDVDTLAAFIKKRHAQSNQEDLVWTLAALLLVRMWGLKLWVATSEDMEPERLVN
jgi:hypothetical protein